MERNGKKGAVGSPRRRRANRGVLKALAACAAALAVGLAIPIISWAWPLTASYGWYTSPQAAGEYVISTGGDLAGFINLVNGTADVDGDGTVDAPDSFAGKTVSLGASIDMRNSEIVPIGGQGGHSFDGTFDGKSYTLSSFTVIANGSNQNIGLFGQTGTSSTIKNLNISGGKVVVAELAGTGKAVRNVGIVGGLVQGSLLNCTVNSTSSVSVTNPNATTAQAPIMVANVGGVAGIVFGDIQGNSNAASVSVSATGAYTDKDSHFIVVNVGGVVGCAGDMDASFDPSTTKAFGSLSGCSNSGTVTVSTPAEVGEGLWSAEYALSAAVGGVAGYIRGDASGLSNSGYVNTDHGHYVGGVAGSLRGPKMGVGYDGGSTTNGDEGTQSQQVVTLSNSTNTGNVYGYCTTGGIVGMIGSYGQVVACQNGVEGAVGNTQRQNWVVGQRSNKPFVGGIAGLSFGDVAFCSNMGNVATGSWKVVGSEVVVNSGYYCSGILGGERRHQVGADFIGPVPAVYSCINMGPTWSKGGRTRNIVGLSEEGILYDNFALEGMVTDANNEEGSNSMAYESLEGVNAVLTVQELKDNLPLPESVAGANGRTPLAVLNSHAAGLGWSVYWVVSSDDANSGLPVLSDSFAGQKSDLSGATAVQTQPAPFINGPGSVPQVDVTLPNGVKLIQDVDFRVIPQADAAAMTDPATPYTGTVIGIGTYEGSVSVSYGIGKGRLEDCRVSITPTQFDWKAQSPSASDITVLSSAGTVIDPGEYTFSWEGEMVNSGNYTITVTAKDSATSVTGSVTGTYRISKVSLVYNYDEVSDPELFNKRAHAVSIQTVDGYADWQTDRLLTDDAQKAEIALTYPYTGHPIVPMVKATYLDRELGIVVLPNAQLGIAAVSTGASPNQLLLAPGFVSDLDHEEADSARDNIGSPTEKTVGGVLVAGYGTSSNFESNDSMSFYIDPSVKADLKAAEPRISDEPYAYEGVAVMPVSQVVYLGSLLDEGSDYVVTYADNDKPGQASFTIKPGTNGIFTGSYTGTFEISGDAAYEFTFSDNEDGTAAVTGVVYSGSSSTFNMVIPDTTPDGKIVTTIAAKAFAPTGTGVGGNGNNKKIGVVTIPSTVTAIGENAFAGSSASDDFRGRVSGVVFADVDSSQLTTIGANAFAYCPLTSFEFPASVTTIGQGAFSYCTSLQSLVFHTRDEALPSAVGTRSFANVGSSAADGEVLVSCYDEAAAVKSLVEANAALTGTTANGGHHFVLAPHNGALSRSVSFAAAQGAYLALPETSYVFPGASVVLPSGEGVAAPGYTFGGWKASSDGSVLMPGASFTVQNDTVFEAVLEPLSVSVYIRPYGQSSYGTPVKVALPEAGLSTAPLSVQFGTADATSVLTAGHYAKLSDVLKKAGVDASRVDGIAFADAKGTKLSVSWETLTSGFFYPHSGKTVASFAAADAVAVEPALAVSVATSPVSTTADAARKANEAASQTFLVAPQLVTGIPEDQATSAAAYAPSRLMEGVASVYVDLNQDATFADAQVSGVNATYKYTGSAITPAPTVKVGSTVLKAGTDYTVSYANNVKLGTATITLTPQGAYKGQQTLKVTFSIVSADLGRWVQASDGRWWFSLKSGGYPTGWFDIDGTWYLFDAAGWMLTGWQQVGGTWYYLKASGAMAEGWQSVGGTWYYLRPGSGAMATGWLSVGGEWYYLNGSGAMVTGWASVGGHWYYLKASGVMAEGWQSVGGSWYWLTPGSGVMATGWYTVDGEWQWSDASGVWHPGSWVSASGGKWWYSWPDGTYPAGSWQLIGGSWYLFDASGYMLTGWQQVSGAWYYLEPSGAMAASKWVGDYYVGASGAMAVNQWVGPYWVGADGKWVPGMTKERLSMAVSVTMPVPAEPQDALPEPPAQEDAAAVAPEEVVEAAGIEGAGEPTADDVVGERGQAAGGDEPEQLGSAAGEAAAQAADAGVGADAGGDAAVAEAQAQAA